jgi:hypothetical protein
MHEKPTWKIFKSKRKEQKHYQLRPKKTKIPLFIVLELYLLHYSAKLHYKIKSKRAHASKAYTTETRIKLKAA